VLLQLGEHEVLGAPDHVIDAPQLQRAADAIVADADHRERVARLRAGHPLEVCDLRARWKMINMNVYYRNAL